MTGQSSAPSDKPGKNNKDLSFASVKDEFASSSKGNSCMKIEYEILMENHKTLKIDYASLQTRVKHEQQTYEVMKKLLQSKSEGLEVKNTHLVEDFVRERSEKDKYKKMFEEMKMVESDRKAKIDGLRKREEELFMATRRGKEDAAKLKNKFVALAERFGLIEADCSYLKALYDAEVAATGLGEIVNLIGHEGNNNVKNNATDSIMISHESDDEHNDPTRESNLNSQRSVDKGSQEDQCKNQEIFTALPQFSASPSLSSSSSDGYDVVFKRPANWPEWAMPKGPGDDSNKS